MGLTESVQQIDSFENNYHIGCHKYSVYMAEHELLVTKLNRENLIKKIILFENKSELEDYIAFYKST
jgi:hypothetical protein